MAKEIKKNTASKAVKNTPKAATIKGTASKSTSKSEPTKSPNKTSGTKVASASAKATKKVATSTKKVASKPQGVKASTAKGTNSAKPAKKANVTKAPLPDTPIKKVLVSQPKPTSEKSPYYDLATKYNLELTFHQFIKVEGLTGKEFKKQDIDFNNFTGIIMLSRNAVDHFFRVCGEIKHKVSQELRYFCASESIALYLQKFIIYRKRKVFFSADGSPEGLVDVMMKFSDSQFIMPVSENTKNEITPRVKAKKLALTETVLYRTIGNDLQKIVPTDYDLVLFFSPFGIEAAMKDMVDVKKKNIRIGTFGATTTQAAEEQGLNLIIKAPTPQAPSMITALDQYLKKK